MSTLDPGDLISWQQHGGRRRRQPPTVMFTAAAAGGVALLLAARWGYLHNTQLFNALSAVLVAPLATQTGVSSLKAFVTWIKG